MTRIRRCATDAATASSFGTTVPVAMCGRVTNMGRKIVQTFANANQISQRRRSVTRNVRWLYLPNCPLTDPCPQCIRWAFNQRIDSHLTQHAAHVWRHRQFLRSRQYRCSAEFGMSRISNAWKRLRIQVRDLKPQLWLSLRVTVAALVSFVLGKSLQQGERRRPFIFLDTMFSGSTDQWQSGNIPRKNFAASPKNWVPSRIFGNMDAETFGLPQHAEIDSQRPSVRTNLVATTGARYDRLMNEIYVSNLMAMRGVFARGSCSRRAVCAACGACSGLHLVGALFGRQCGRLVCA
jgi:hypothetical protein